MPFCTYITIYSGNLLPPFYIGSTSISKIQEGYRGSVSSKKYRYIWNDELKHHPELFITKIISIHNNRKEALDKEIFLHNQLRVHKNDLYINQCTASGKFGLTGKLSNVTKQKLRELNVGKKHTLETKAKMSLTHKNLRKKLNEDHKLKLLNSNIGRPCSQETRDKIRLAKLGKKFTDEHKLKLSIAHKKLL